MARNAYKLPHRFIARWHSSFPQRECQFSRRWKFVVMPTCQISLGRGKRLGRVSFNCRRSDARWIIFSAAHACRACYGARVFQKRRTRTLGGYVITLVYQRPCTILAFRYRGWWWYYGIPKINVPLVSSFINTPRARGMFRITPRDNTE